MRKYFIAGEILRLREELCSLQAATRQSLGLQDSLVGRARQLQARAAQYRQQVRLLTLYLETFPNIAM